MIRFPKPAAFKKFALPTLVPTTVALVGFLLPAPSRAAAVSVAADLAPADALVFLGLPDPVHTFTAWRGTELFKLWDEPEVRTFLERPLALVPANPVINETLASLGKIEPREVFVAVTPGLPDRGPVRLVAGFHFDPKRQAELTSLLELPKARMLAGFPAGRAETADHRGQPLEIFYSGRGDDLVATATRAADGWYLISSDLDLLRAALDRLLDGPKPDRASLGTEADFRAVRARLPADVETLTFVRPAAIAGLIPETANIPPGQRERLKGLRAAGAVTAFAPGGLIRDTAFALLPDQPAPATGPLDLPALGLGTAADTVFFGSGRLPSRGPAAGAGGALGGMLGGMLAGRGITPERFSAAFGEEIGVVVQWTDGPGGSPSGTLALPVKDRAAAQEVLAKFVAVPLQESPWEPRSLPPPPPAAGGDSPGESTSAYIMRHGGGGMNLTPTLVLGSRFLFLAASPDSAQSALARERRPAAGAETLATAESYRVANAGAGPMPDLSFDYLDWRRLFERAYAAARPMLAVSALVMPKVTEFVDVDHLPAATTISRHLGPATLTQRGTSDGVLLESTGTLPLTQAAGLSVLGLYLGAFAEGLRAHSPGSPAPGKKAPIPEASASPH